MSSFFTLPASQRKRKLGGGGGARGDGDSVSKRGGGAFGRRGPGRASAGFAKGRVNDRQRRSEEEGETGDGGDNDSEISSGSSSDEDMEGDNDSEITSGESSGEEAGGDTKASEVDEAGEPEDEEETAAERRLRLAERYLSNVKEEVDEIGFDAEEIDRDLIAERLREDVDESKGRAFRQIAERLEFTKSSHSTFRADTQVTTSVAVYPPYAYTVSKDRTLIKWELITPVTSKDEKKQKEEALAVGKSPKPERKKPKKLKWVRGLQTVGDEAKKQGHKGRILAVAVSPSGKFLATGGDDNKIVVWDAVTLAPLHTFSQHRDSVSYLAFSRSISKMNTGEQLFSASFDRTIKSWSLSPGAHTYVETLFGHQDNVLSVTSMALDQCVSVGARDLTARLWKVVEESQMIFRGGTTSKRTDVASTSGSRKPPAQLSSSTTTSSAYVEGSLDCVAVIPPEHFITGSDSGALSLWSMNRKKPLFTVPLAHGVDPLPPLGDLSSEINPDIARNNTNNLRPNPRWITALTSIPGTDVVLSGSWDGCVRVWKVSKDKKSIIPLGSLGGASVSGSTSNNEQMDVDEGGTNIAQGPVKGIVNDIAVFERRGPDPRQLLTAPTPAVGSAPNQKPSAYPPENERKGVCVVVALGKEHRLGRWKTFGSKREANTPAGRNGAVVFEIPLAEERKN